MKTLSCLVLAFGLVACTGKPSEEKCRQAVDNIRLLTGQDRAEGGVDPKGAIRSCRARSSRQTVECQIAARSLADLAACEGEEGKKYLEELDRQDAERTRTEGAEGPAPATPQGAAPAPAGDEAAEPK
jgi:hypothetical protein